MKYLDSDSVNLLREVLNKNRNVLKNLRGRNFANNENSQAPEVYIAKLLNSLIPSSPFSMDNADASIYQIVDNQLILVESLTKVTFNLMTDYVFTNYFFPVVRDKFGKWIANIG